MVYLCFFFFFKQKTAYEMLSGDWSSDVCSSDLTTPFSWSKTASVHQKQPPAKVATSKDFETLSWRDSFIIVASFSTEPSSSGLSESSHPPAESSETPAIGPIHRSITKTPFLSPCCYHPPLPNPLPAKKSQERRPSRHRRSLWESIGSGKSPQNKPGSAIREGGPGRRVSHT